MYTIVFVDFFFSDVNYCSMKNECKKCNVVHNDLARNCLSCGAILKTLNVERAIWGAPALIVTTFLSVSAVFLSFNPLLGG